MDGYVSTKLVARADERIILHFDVDSFYAAVFEIEDPALKSLPLAIKQKHIAATVNYEARRRGLYKLQLISEAQRICPDLVVVSGEDLTRFRDASKSIYAFLRSFAWNRRAERLGFDEVWLDVSDIIQYNLEILNWDDRAHSFFHLTRDDPTKGFTYDATAVRGGTYPETATSDPLDTNSEFNILQVRLLLGSHLAYYIRKKLEEELYFTSSVGIATNKILSKLVGSCNKPNGQTTLMPPYAPTDTEQGNVASFLDAHEIGKLPNIGFRSAHRIRSHVLGRTAEFDEDLVYGATKDVVTAHDVRCFPGMGPRLLDKLLAGPGASQSLGKTVWELINGIDDSEVAMARSVPRQISIEDSYLRLDNLDSVHKELLRLTRKLVARMRIDLLQDDEDRMNLETDTVSLENQASPGDECEGKRWMAFPKNLRLSTRPRPRPNSDGSMRRSFHRISRSCPMPSFVFRLSESSDDIANRLVNDVLMGQFRKLHPERSGWDLSLLNVAAANMSETTGGADIGLMFQHYDSLSREWRVPDVDVPPDSILDNEGTMNSVEHKDETMHAEESIAVQEQGALLRHKQQSQPEDGMWEDSEIETDTEAKAVAENGQQCPVCEAVILPFVMAAHQRFHLLGD